MMLPMAGVVGGAVDYGHAVAERTRINTAMDGAVLVAAKAAQDADSAGKSDAEVRSAAEKAGADYFGAMKNLPTGTVGKIEVKLTDRVASIGATYTSSMPTTMLGVLGFKSLPISGNASASVNLSPLVDIYLLIDVSGSMAIGATSDDIAKLQKRFGCAFACHDNVPVTDVVVTGNGRNQKVTTTIYADSFDWAQKNNVNLRINEINKGITDFVNDLMQQTAASKRLRISVHSFSNDLTQIVPLTSVLSNALTSLPKSPNSSSEYEGATHFSDVMPAFAKVIGTPGDGSSSPRKLVIIATDGVQDPNGLGPGTRRCAPRSGPSRRATAASSTRTYRSACSTPPISTCRRTGATSRPWASPASRRQGHALRRHRASAQSLRERADHVRQCRDHGIGRRRV